MAFKYRKRADRFTNQRIDNPNTGHPDIIKRVPGIKYYKPEAQNHIRLLPPTWEEARHYGMELYEHFSVGVDEHRYLCTLKMEEVLESIGIALPEGIDPACPICDERGSVDAEDFDSDKQYKDAISALRPKQRTGVLLIDRNRESDGVCFWAIPYTVDTEIITQSRDEDTREILTIDDPDMGFDVRFNREGQGKQSQYKGIRLKNKPSPLSTNPREQDAWLRIIEKNPMPKLLNFYSYDKMLKDFRGNRKDKEGEEVESPKRGATARTRSTPTETLRKPKPARKSVKAATKTGTPKKVSTRTGGKPLRKRIKPKTTRMSLRDLRGQVDEDDD